MRRHRVPPIEDARLVGANLDEALEIGHQLLRAIEGAFPVGIVAEPLRGGSYLIRIAWQTDAGVGGRRARKRYQNHSREYVPPQRSRDERIPEELADD